LSKGEPSRARTGEEEERRRKDAPLNMAMMVSWMLRILLTLR